jgi:hypothetical protein
VAVCLVVNVSAEKIGHTQLRIHPSFDPRLREGSHVGHADDKRSTWFQYSQAFTDHRSSLSASVVLNIMVGHDEFSRSISEHRHLLAISYYVRREFWADVDITPAADGNKLVDESTDWQALVSKGIHAVRFR